MLVEVGSWMDYQNLKNIVQKVRLYQRQSFPMVTDLRGDSRLIDRPLMQAMQS